MGSQQLLQMMFAVNWSPPSSLRGDFLLLRSAVQNMPPRQVPFTVLSSVTGLAYLINDLKNARISLAPFGSNINTPQNLPQLLPFSPFSPRQAANGRAVSKLLLRNRHCTLADNLSFVFRFKILVGCNKNLAVSAYPPLRLPSFTFVAANRFLSNLTVPSLLLAGWYPLEGFRVVLALQKQIFGTA